MQLMTKTFYYLTCLLAVLLLAPSCAKNGNEINPEDELDKMRPIRYVGSYARDFNDLPDLHLEATSRIGIEPLDNRESVRPVGGGLIEIRSCKYYEVEELTHSVPYLVPEAALLLYHIGKNFADSLENHRAPVYKPIVTSVTRTWDDIRRLGRSNVNASENSAHLYGATFDISWRRFVKMGQETSELSEEQLKMILAMVLRDLQKEGKCYIKHERKQACFHITAREMKTKSKELRIKN
jgi:hypothetical protein